MKKLILTIALLLGWLLVFSKFQPVRIVPPVSPRKEVPGKITYKESKTKLPFIKEDEKIQDPDTVYAISTVKQHGWFKPLRTIEKKDANKYDLVYVFTHKNEEGHWCRVEYIDNYGRPTFGNVQPHIMKIDSETDSVKNPLWVDKVKTITRIDMIPDVTGNQVVQERAYDSFGKLVFSFSVSPIDDSGKKFVGSYKDFYGLPAEMRKQENFSYGTLIYIERDRWGGDSLLMHIDSKGFVKPNSDGVYAEIFVNDQYGRQIKNQSTDANGKLIFDLTGNCGYEYEYDEKHNITIITCMDPSWRPMKMRRANDEMRYIQKYDEYGRIIERINVDENNNPVANAVGTYKIVFQYDKYGNICKRVGYGLNGEESPFLDFPCREEIKYDSIGYILEDHLFGADGKPISHPTLYSTIVSEIDYENGYIKSEKCYRADENGLEILSYCYNKDKDKIEVLYDDGRKEEKFYDEDGRIIIETYMNGEGILDDNVTHPLIEYFYDVPLEELPISNIYLHSKINVTCYYDSNVNLNEILYKNPDESYVVLARYDEDGSIREIFAKEWKNDEETRQDDVNAFGTVARTGGSGGTLSYQANVEHSLGGELAGYYGTDEFGEPNYMSDETRVFYHTFFYSKNKKFFNRDENDREITSFSLMKDSLPKFIVAEVTDRRGYENGFKDNDVILFVNNVGINPYSSDLKFRTDKVHLCVNSAIYEKEVVVFRIDPMTLETSCQLIKLGKGRIEDHGVTLHYFYSTQRQKQRIDSVFSQSVYATSKIEYLEGIHKGVTINAYTSKSAKNYEYNWKVGKDAVLVGAELEEFPLINWKYGEDYQKIDNIISKRLEMKGITGSYPSLNLFLTFDGINVEKFTIERQPGCRFSESEINEDFHIKLLGLTEGIIFSKEEPFVKVKNVSSLTDQEREEMLVKAEAYYAAGFYNVAFPLYKKLYEGGVSESSGKLALCHAYGLGTKQNMKKAEKLALKAKDQGLTLCSLADCYTSQGKDKKALAVLEIIDDTNTYYDRAQKKMGDIIVKTDSEKAISHYFNALKDNYSLSRTDETKTLLESFAQLENFEALQDSIQSIALNLCFERRKDIEAFRIFEALTYYEYEDAFPFVVIFVLKGFGTKKDIETAYMYAKRHYILSGSTASYLTIANYYIDQQDFQSALSLLRENGDRGEYQFKMNYEIGRIYNNSDYYGHNLNQALEAYTVALSKNGYFDPDEVGEIVRFYDEYFPNHPLSALGKLYIGWEYSLNRRYREALVFFNQAYEIDPSLRENPTYSDIYYMAHHERLLKHKKDYEEFMKDHIFRLTVPENIDSDSGLAPYVGQTFDVLCLNRWDLTDVTPGTFIFGEINQGINRIVLKPADKIDVKLDELIILETDGLSDEDIKLICVPEEYKEDALNTFRLQSETSL